MSWKLGAVLWASACLAAGPFEAGGFLGYGAYRTATVFAPDGTATAGIDNRFVAGAFFSEDLYEHLSGELRYVYQDGDPFVTAGGQRGNIQGQSHAVHYDFLIRPLRRDARLQPYFAVGAGMKYYRTAGPAPVTQPLPQIVTLASRSEVSGLFTEGVGVKYRLTGHIFINGDFLDYVTKFPRNLFVPAAGGTDRGIFHQFTPSLGVSVRL